MHELSLAESIVRIAERHAAGRPVTRVHVAVGHLRQVVPDSLAFAFELLSAGTALEGAALDITEVPAEARCRDCGTRGAQRRLPMRCDACGGFDLEIVRGEELRVEALEVEDLATTNQGRTHGG